MQYRALLTTFNITQHELTSYKNFVIHVLRVMWGITKFVRSGKVYVALHVGF